VKFAKMHGLGNDFMVVDAIEHPITLSRSQIQQWADRHTGVGFDQLLLIEKNARAHPPFAYKIYNADGSAAEQCGNGARCIGRYLLDHGWVKERQFALQAPLGDIVIAEQENGHISVDMGQPCFAPEKIPFLVDHVSETYQYSLALSAQAVALVVLSMGNPHAVLFVADIALAPVATIGYEIANNKAFPHGVNVELVQILSKNQMKIRVLERGTGETRACGSGACAAMVAGRLLHNLDEEVTVSLLGGQLSINWQGLGYPVIMTGAAMMVYRGEIV
jgi:diaminopimelate epimerase